MAADAQTADAQTADGSLHQAGGGISHARQTIQTLDKCLLACLRRLFEAHAGPDGKWSSSQTNAFIHKVQGHHAETAEAAAHLLRLDELDLSGFLAYMASSDSVITMLREKEDHSWPLASYFISSSHNTYLTGNQLLSDSTTGAYTNVLLRGCRCVEIDVWDGDESDSETSDSDASGDESVAKKAALREKMKESKEKRRRSAWGALNHIKGKLPGSVTSKLDKMHLGRRIGEKAAADGMAEGEPEVAAVEPRVLHGHTLTKDVSFRDVCVAIRESAFAVTDLPLIASLEVHCNVQQQGVMVDIMKDVWDGLLVAEPDAAAAELPSPAALRRKILVKVKHTPSGSPINSVKSPAPAPAPTGALKPKKASKTIPALSRLGIYTKAVSFKSWAQPEAAMPTHIFSLSEKKFINHSEKQWAELFRHNKQYLMRAYPSSFRISSSNLNPAVFWGGGAQVVALNWQQTDEGMMLNEGMFAGTGGYVLKPEGYRPNLKSKASSSSSSSSPNTISRKSLSLSLTFLAAQSIPLPPDEKSPKGFKPYIKVELHVDASSRTHDAANNDGHAREGEYKARTQTHRGCHVDLQAERLEFRDIPALVEELTFVRFTVRDDELGRDDLAAWACVRLDRLGQGYRFVHLMDAKGVMTEGVVLVKVKKTLV